MTLNALVVVAAALAMAAEPVPPAIGAKVANFTAKGADGQPHSLKDYAGKKAIVIIVIGTECPVSNLYVVTLREMQQQYESKGVQLLAINSNDFDTYDEMVAHAKDRKINFPVLKDEDHSAVDAIGARRTPEAFLLDAQQIIRYHGRIDDQYGIRYRRASPTKTELKDAIDELLAGKPIAVPESDASQGCLIGRSKKAAK